MVKLHQIEGLTQASCQLCESARRPYFVT